MAITVKQRQKALATFDGPNQCEKTWAADAEKAVDFYLLHNQTDDVPLEIIRKHRPRCQANFDVVVNLVIKQYREWIIERRSDILHFSPKAKRSEVDSDNYCEVGNMGPGGGAE